MFRKLALVTVVLAVTFTPLAGNAAISPDNTYGTGGVASVPLGCAPGTVSNVARTAGFNGGLFILAECANGYDRLTALTSDGKVDPTFGTDGHLVIKFSPPCWGTSVHLQSIAYSTGRGQLFIASEGRTTSGDMHVCIVRVTTTGKLYPAYGGKWETPDHTSSVSTPFRHLDRVGGGKNRLVGFVATEGGLVDVFTERLSTDWRKSAFFVNRYASNGNPNPNFSGDGQRTFVQPYAKKQVWGGGGTIAISVNNGRGLAGVQVIAYDIFGNLDTDFAHDGSRFLSRSDLGGADVVPDQVVRDVTASGRGLVFATHHPGPGKQWIDLALLGPTGVLRSSFGNATQKISALSASDLNGIRLQLSDDHYVIGWNAGNLPHTTGFNPDGTRWTALGPNGTAKVLAPLWARDQAAYYDFDYQGQPLTSVDITRSLVE